MGHYNITYIKTYQGWSYLASILDLASRQVVGWALSKQPNTKLAQDAMDNAINRYQPNTDNLMFHSDQGVILPFLTLAKNRISVV